MVEFVDGSILAQISVTDMRLPILYALTFPERIASDMRFPVMNLRHLDFSPPDMEKFPCLQLAYKAAEAGGSKPVALNAADEVAVAAFLEVRSVSIKSLRSSRKSFLKRSRTIGIYTTGARSWTPRASGGSREGGRAGWFSPAAADFSHRTRGLEAFIMTRIFNRCDLGSRDSRIHDPDS